MMVLDLSLEHLVFDGLEPITLEGVLILRAYRSDIIDTEGSPSEGIYLHSDVEWQIPTGYPAPPRVGETIIAMGTSYLILSVRKPFLNDYYGCACRKVAVESDLALSSKITLYPAIVGEDGYGHDVVNNDVADVVFVDVPARIQDMTADQKEWMGKRGFERIFHITCATEIDVHYRDILKDATGRVFDIVSWKNRSRIDELSLIVARIKD